MGVRRLAPSNYACAHAAQCGAQTLAIGSLASRAMYVHLTPFSRNEALPDMLRLDSTLVRHAPMRKYAHIHILTHTTSFFDGFANRDTAFFHPASRTLIEADLLFNLPATEQVCPHA